MVIHLQVRKREFPLVALPDVMEGNNANRSQILGQINSSAARTIFVWLPLPTWLTRPLLKKKRAVVGLEPMLKMCVMR